MLRSVTGALVAVLCLACFIDHASASCVAPALSIDRQSAAAGDTVEIRGEYFGDGCNDVFVDGTAAGRPLGEPRTGVVLAIVQDDLAISLVIVDADFDYKFSVRVAIPSGLHAGPATIQADVDPAAAVTLNITSTPATTGTAAATSTVVRGPIATAPPEVRAGDGGSAAWPWIGGTLAAILVGLVAVLVARRRGSRGSGRENDG